MKSKNIFLCLLIGLVLTALLICSCQSNQQSTYQQENQILQQTIETQQTEIERLKQTHDQIAELLAETTTKLKKCQQQLAKLKREKQITEKARQFAPGDLEKRIEELKALREEKAKRMKEAAEAEAKENN
jgi:uncharacterized membrane-anchored protein YhcB (DUF1043 family)